MEWVRVSDTKLAKEIGSKVAGRLLAKAGFAKKKAWYPDARRTYALVDARATNLNKIEVEGIIAFGGAAAPGLAQRTIENATPAVKRAEANLPPYGELVKIIENQNALIELLQEENGQLKQCEADCREEIRQLRAITNPVNGMGERARKALLAAGRNLKP